LKNHPLQYYPYVAHGVSIIDRNSVNNELSCEQNTYKPAAFYTQ